MGGLTTRNVWLTLQILVEIAQNARANSRTELAWSDNGGLFELLVAA